MFLLINYDLHGPSQNYTKLFELIKGCGPAIRCLASSWLLRTTLSAESIFQHLKPAIDTNDNLLVTRITDDRQGWMPQQVWDWLNANR